MKLLLITTLLLNSCNDLTQNNELNTINSKVSEVVQNETKNIKTNTDLNYLNFISNFKEKKLPFELTLGNNDWISFASNDFKEISANDAIKYLLDKNKNKLKDPNGGNFQFYYGYSINLSDSIIGLIYYKTMSLGYIGYYFATYSKNGKFINEIFIAGSKGEYDIEAQKEAKILAENYIQITELVVKQENIADKNKIKYQIKTTGEIKKINEEKVKNVPIETIDNPILKIKEKT